jgi:hypothetical protein
MEFLAAYTKRAQREAALVLLDAFREGRPMREMRVALPNELEATGQYEVASVVRMLFNQTEAATLGRRVRRLSEMQPAP